MSYKYAKLIDGQPQFAPNPILHNDTYIGNPPVEILLAEGYKPVTYTEQPEPLGVGRWVEVWVEDNLNIYNTWEWHEATDEDEISPEEALDMLLGGEGG